MTSLIAGPALRERGWRKVLWVSYGLTVRGPDPAEAWAQHEASSIPHHLFVQFYFPLAFKMPFKRVHIFPASPPSCSFLFPADSLHWLLCGCCLSHNDAPRRCCAHGSVGLCRGAPSWIPETQGQSDPIRLARGGGVGGTRRAKAFFCPSRCLSDHPF